MDALGWPSFFFCDRDSFHWILINGGVSVISLSHLRFLTVSPIFLLFPTILFLFLAIFILYCVCNPWFVSQNNNSHVKDAISPQYLLSPQCQNRYKHMHTSYENHFNGDLIRCWRAPACSVDAPPNTRILRFTSARTLHHHHHHHGIQYRTMGENILIFGSSRLPAGAI